MKNGIVARVVSVHAGSNDDLSKEIPSTAFSKAAKLTRGIVGVVEAAGTISAGDEVAIEIYETPPWLRRAAD